MTTNVFAGLTAQRTDPATTRQALERRRPSGRLVTAQEVAGAVAYLASSLSGSTTGATIRVDGGMANLHHATTS